MKTFNEQFKADYQHYQQIKASRLVSYNTSGERGLTKTSANAMTVLATKLPPTKAELSSPDKLKVNVATCRRVEAVMLAENLYGGILGNAKFRLTAPAKAKSKAKAKAPAVTVVRDNGATVLARV